MPSALYQVIRTTALACLAVLPLVVAACGGNESTGPLAAASVAIEPDSISLTIGSSRQLAATVRDRKGTLLTGGTVVWSTVDAGLVAVSPAGVVTALSTGRAVIAATSGGKVGEAVVRVDVVPVARVVLSPDSAWM